MKNYIHTLFLLLACISNNLWAQSRPISADQKALNDNFKMVSPTDQSDISKAFRISGYGVPGAKVEIHVTPVSRGGKGPQFVSVPHGKQNPYKVQSYTATVANDGSWKLPESITVNFNEGATERRIHVFAGQSKDALVSKKPINREIKLKDDLKIVAVEKGSLLSDDKVRNDFYIRTKKFKQGITATSPDLQVLLTNDAPFTLGGFAAVGSKVKVEVFYSGTKEVYTKSASALGVEVYTEKKTSNIKDKKLGEWEINIGDKGNWSIPAIDPYRPKSGDVGTSIRMSNITIYVKAFNGSRQVLSKQLNVSPAPGLPAAF